MNILMVADVPPNPNSGAAGTEYQTMLALRAEGHRVDAIWENNLRHRIKHGNLHYLLELPWAYRTAIQKYVAGQNYDVIHVNQPYAWLAAIDHNRRGRTGVFVNRSHGWETRADEVLAPWRRRYLVPEWRGVRGIMGRPMKWLKHRYAAWCAKAVDGIIVSSSEDRDYLVRKYAIGQAKVACIPQAPARVFCADPILPISPERLNRVLYIGTSAFVKGVHTVADIFSSLSEQIPSLTFSWCCPEEKIESCRLLLRPDCRRKVRFVKWMEQDRLVQLYDEHGIFLFPSLYEGFGKSPLEAMARGMCVVASDTGGMRDFIEHGRSGCLVPVGDTDAFCSEVVKIIRHPERALAMGSSARCTAVKYSWQRVAYETVRFYKQCLAMKKENG